MSTPPEAGQPTPEGQSPQNPVQPPEVQPTATQPTVPLQPVSGPPAVEPPLVAEPAIAQQPAYSAPPQGAFVHAQSQPAQPAQTKQRHGGLVAGIAIGALIGGLVGGGSAAVVAHNSNNHPVAQAEKSGTLTLNNLDSATAISGVAAVATPSVVTLQVTGGQGAGSGSGVIYNSDGYIITNAHVATLEGATADPQIQVQLQDGTLLPGKLVGSDPFADIAVVKVDSDALTPIQVADSNEINVGDLAVAIGAPLSLSNTVTSGVVSALYRGISVSSSMLPDEQPEDNSQEQQPGSPFPWFQFENPDGNGESQQQPSNSGARMAIPVIQTDASINPGNSGGALLNANGELIGINVALASATAQSGAAGSDGLGFAVPANFATRVADAIIAGDQPTHGLLGVTQTTEAGGSNHAGGVIGEVSPNSPASRAGLQPGDVITSVDGARADSFTTVTALVRMQAGGSTVTIGYNRDGQQHETEVTLDTLEW